MYIIGHDIGTSGVKSVIATEEGRIVAAATTPLEVRRPKPLQVEQRPSDWLDAIAANCRTLVSQAAVDPSAVEAMSFGAQMQGTLLVDEAGDPIGDCLVWLDMRAAEQSRRAVGGFPSFKGYGLFRLWRWLSLTNGAPGLSGRDPVAKMLWLAEHAPEQWSRAHKVLDVKDYVLGYCTGRFVTSHDCANTTWLMDTRPANMGWSSELCDRLDIDPKKLPEIAKSTDEAGHLNGRAAEHFGLTTKTRVFVGAGDLAAMAVGTGAVAHGELAASLGTSAWISTHIAERKVDLGTYTASICGAVDGSQLLVAHQESGGACLRWLREQTGRQRSYEALLELGAAAPVGSHGLVFLPWMNGEYAPIDDPYVRGGFLNLSFEHDLSHLCRAVLEGVAYNLRWALDAVESLSGACAQPVRVGGGGGRSALWCQTLADTTQRPFLQLAEPELSVARGAAFIGLVGCGALKDFATAQAHVPVHTLFEPDPRHAELHERGFERLTAYYRQNRGWFRRQNSGRAN